MNPCYLGIGKGMRKLFSISRLIATSILLTFVSCATPYEDEFLAAQSIKNEKKYIKSMQALCAKGYENACVELKKFAELKISVADSAFLQARSMFAKNLESSELLKKDYKDVLKGVRKSEQEGILACLALRAILKSNDASKGVALKAVSEEDVQKLRASSCTRVSVVKAFRIDLGQCFSKSKTIACHEAASFMETDFLKDDILKQALFSSFLCGLGDSVMCGKTVEKQWEHFGLLCHDFGRGTFIPEDSCKENYKRFSSLNISAKKSLMSEISLNAKKGCELGVADLCAKSGNIAIVLDEPDAMEYFKKGCDAGGVSACEARSELLAIACSQHKPSSCRELAMLKKEEGDRESAIKVLERACSNQDGLACLSLGNAILERDSTSKENRLRAYDFFEKACQKKISEACGKVTTLEEQQINRKMEFVHFAREAKKAGATHILVHIVGANGKSAGCKRTLEQDYICGVGYFCEIDDYLVNPPRDPVIALEVCQQEDGEFSNFTLKSYENRRLKRNTQFFAPMAVRRVPDQLLLDENNQKKLVASWREVLPTVDSLALQGLDE